MIHPFAYTRASSSDDADQRLAAAGSAPLGGGTDLLVCIREDLARPETLVDLTRIPSAREVTVREDGGLRIGRIGTRSFDLLPVIQRTSCPAHIG